MVHEHEMLVVADFTKEEEKKRPVKGNTSRLPFLLIHLLPHQFCGATAIAIIIISHLFASKFAVIEGMGIGFSGQDNEHEGRLSQHRECDNDELNFHVKDDGSSSPKLKDIGTCVLSNIFDDCVQVCKDEICRFSSRRRKTDTYNSFGAVSSSTEKHNLNPLVFRCQNDKNSKMCCCTSNQLQQSFNEVNCLLEPKSIDKSDNYLTNKLYREKRSPSSLYYQQPIHAQRRSRSCEIDIHNKYPGAVCHKTFSMKECEETCYNSGRDKCGGSKGKTKQLVCGNTGLSNLEKTCCCMTECEESGVTHTRLEDALGKDMNYNDEGQFEFNPDEKICINSTKENIRNDLKDACNNDQSVLIARKYCMDILSGEYFCLKNGKCLGQVCKGCIQHECQKDGEEKKVFTVPQYFVRRRQNMQDFQLQRGEEGINVDDKRNVVKSNKKWCTTTDSVQSCRAECKSLGDSFCHETFPLKYDPVHNCEDGDTETCSCCCQPVCSNSKPTNPDKTPTFYPGIDTFKARMAANDVASLSDNFEYGDNDVMIDNDHMSGYDFMYETK